jgi:hypothetical protein
MSFEKKISLDWHQRDLDNWWHSIGEKWKVNGWGWVSDSLYCLHNPKAPIFISYLDEVVDRRLIEEKFVGVLHHAPVHPNHERYSLQRGLQHTITTDFWKRNEHNCLGIFTLCEYTKQFLENKISIPVSTLPRPVKKLTPPFDLDSFISNKNKRVLFVGAFLRNFHAFGELKCPYKKTILQIAKTLDRESPQFTDVETISFVDAKDYTELLSKNIVFSYYHDVAASTTVVECLSTNTPLVINRLPALEEYLGKNYPLFYETLEEAECILSDIDKITEGHKYLSEMNKDRFTISNFLQEFVSSKVYKSLPSPTKSKALAML